MKTQSTAPTPELLAAANSWGAALAALDAGADALRTRFRGPRARDDATGLALADLKRLVPLAHAEGRRVYAAFDGLVTEEEIPGLAPELWELACAGVDAFAVRDLGLWHLCRGAFPEMPLQASPQLAAHNSAGVGQLARMGFSRASLAPECTIPELAEIRRKSALPLEVLVQGPLCFSISGTCLASGLLAGRCAGRGECAEPCRWSSRSREDRTGRELHPFSPSGLSLIGRVWDLVRAGATSLRIDEPAAGGEQVHPAVRAYRKVLDAPAGDREGALGAAREILRSAGGRQTTEGFAFHPHPKEVLEKGGPSATGGEEIGEVLRWRDGAATIVARARVSPGDRLRFRRLGGRDGETLVLPEVRAEKIGKRTALSFACALEVRPGDAVYRVGTARGRERAKRFEEGARSLPEPQGLPLDLTVSFEGEVLRIRARCGPVERAFSSRVPMHPALAHPLDRGVLEKRLGRLGETGYRLARLSTEGPVPPVVIPPSAFKAAVREVAAGMDEARRDEGSRRLSSAASLRRPSPAQRTEERLLWVRSEAPHTLEAAAERPFCRAVVPVTRVSLKARDRIAASAGGPENVVWELPVWIPEADLGAWRRDLEALRREGFSGLALANLAHLSLADGLSFELHGGRELHSLNGWAAAALGELGCASFTPSPETDRANLRAIAGRGWPLRPVLLAYGELPLFSTRLDPDGARGVPSGGPLETSGGVEVRWAPGPSARGREWFLVHGGPPYSLTHRLDELGALGIADFLFDFGGRRYSSAEARAVLARAETGSGVPHSTEATFERGLE